MMIDHAGLRRRRGLPALLAATLLSGCGGGVIPPPASPGFTPATPRPAQPQGGAANGIVGAEARALTRLLGEPRLDIRDPAVRKLQFSNGRCVLDAYLYPTRSRREPVVTYAEARLPDGTAMDVAACAAQLKGR